MNENHYIHPANSAVSWLIELLCNSAAIKKIRRAVFSSLPFLKMKSEVKGVVYVNWLVDTHMAARFVPNNISLIDINGKTLLSVLTYQHGNFRPSIFNFIYFVFPSPFQSNWRFYASSLNDAATSNTVLFIKNIMSSTLFTISTRLFSDAMQTHLSNEFTHAVENNQTNTLITQGSGSSPDFMCNTQFSDDFKIPSELSEYFGGDKQAIKYLCLQDFAFSEGEDFNGVCKAEIKLPIDTSQIIPLSITAFESDWLNAITKEAMPFAFFVPSVQFEVLNEQLV